MVLSPETTLREIVETYPYMLDWLESYRPEYSKLKNPMMMKTIGAIATLDTIAGMGDVPLHTLIADMEAEIDRYESAKADEENRLKPAEEGAGATEAPDTRGEDVEGRERREDELKEIIRSLHDGASAGDVKARFAALVDEVDATEVARMEEALIAEGLPATEIQRLCDVHVEVFKEQLEAAPETELPPGHPVDTFRRENRVMEEIAGELRRAGDELASGALEEGAQQQKVAEIATGLSRLADIDVHYVRKENQLFPILERHGVTGPTQVMWGIHDDIRELMKLTRRAAETGETDKVVERLPGLLGAIEDMAFKEEKVLFPVALEHLSEEEWAIMHAGEPAIGYAWIEPPEEIAVEQPAGVEPQTEALDELSAAAPKEAVQVQPPSEVALGRPSEPPAGQPSAVEQAAGVGPEVHAAPLDLLFLETGAITPDQVDLLLTSLPFDITFVDENDEVRYYSEGQRIFPRSPAVIGRSVKNCHPPKSVGRVMRIISDFRLGERNTAEFWLEHEERFVHIRYFALRDRDGAYKGVLEVVQDATHVRELTGEKRLED